MKEDITKGLKGECVPLSVLGEQKESDGSKPVHQASFHQFKPFFYGSFVVQGSHSDSVGSVKVSSALFLQVFKTVEPEG